MNEFDVEMMDNSQLDFITLHEASSVGVDHITTSDMITTIIN
jgi:hypothetical protein